MRAFRTIAILVALATVGIVSFFVTLRAIENLSPAKMALGDQRVPVPPRVASNAERRMGSVPPAAPAPLRARPNVQIIEPETTPPAQQAPVPDEPAAIGQDQPLPMPADSSSAVVATVAPPVPVPAPPQGQADASQPSPAPRAQDADTTARATPQAPSEPPADPGGQNVDTAGLDPSQQEPFLPSVLPGCMDPQAIREPDIARNRDLLRTPGVCIEEVRFQEGGRNWDLYVVTNTRKPGPLWAVPHDNEDAAFDTASYGLVKYGGTIVAVEAKEQRFFAGQDPNRNFATSADAVKVCSGASSPAPKFVRAFVDRLLPHQSIIALHSNDPGYQGDGRGGAGTISGRLKTSIMLPFISAVAKGRFADPDTLLIVPIGTPFAGNKNAQNLLQWFSSRGINVVFESISPRTNDCSMSNYVALHHLAPYFNVEVVHGDTTTQQRIVDKIFEFMNSNVYVGML